jgi:hypothetical protein
MITRRLFMALAATSAALAASPVAALRIGRAAPTVGEVWGLGFLAPGGSRVEHAPPNLAIFPTGAWHPDFV